MKDIQIARGVRIGIIMVLLLVPNIVLAQWIPDGVPVSTEDYDQHHIDMISHEWGGAIIVWSDKRSGEYEIYAQRLNASGIARWTTGGVEVCTQTATYDYPGYPQITSDGAGGAIITWHDGRNGNFDIYAQRLNASGSTLWTVGGVAVCTKSGSQYFPKITSDGAGGAIIAWMDGYDIYAQRIDADGSIHSGWAIGGEAICTADGEQFEHQIASDGSGGAIIVWRDERFSMWAFDIYAQRINSSGAVQWTPDGQLICGNSHHAQIIPDGAGGAIITFNKQVTEYGYIEINVQRINASGILQWPNEGMACGTEITNQPYFQADPQIISDGAGGTIITWQDNRTGNEFDIYAQRVNSSGATMWMDDGVGICIYTDTQFYPQIATDGAGGAIITWVDSRNGNDDIYAQRIDADGSRHAGWPSGGFGICTYTGDQSGPQITSDGSGKAIIAWEDSRAASIDIYAQRTGPLCDVAPTSLNFGTVDLGNSNELTFTITNNGSGTLAGSVSGSSPHYSIVSTVPPDDPYNLANGEQLVVTVRFEPMSAGTHTCTIETGDAVCSNVFCTGVGGCLAGTLYYVDADATGTGSGTSWEDAFTELLDALWTAEICSGVAEIWVAEGTYKPTAGTDRSATFTLQNGLALYGGFDGTETLLSERDIDAHPTILSGAIGDWPSSDNSYHVVTGSNTDSTAVLDGFTVRNGRADGTDDDENGGGMYVNNGSPAVANVTFALNSVAGDGGGMYVNNGSPTVANVKFRYNSAAGFGGGMSNYGGSPMLTNVTFEGNSVSTSGGGMSNNKGSPVLTNVTFELNSATALGGGMYSYDGNPILTIVTFEGNSAAGAGGGMYNSAGEPTLINVIFTDNSASSGGGLYCFGMPIWPLTNVTFSGNSATTQGGGMGNSFSAPIMTNVIMWGDTAPTEPEIFNYKASPVISYSLIQGSGGSGPGWDTSLGTDGGNNIDDDPQFKGAYSPDSPLAVWSSSPAIDAGDNTAVPVWVTTDIDGNPRIYGGVVDMGAYEHQGPPTGIDEGFLTKVTALRSIYPNPFNPVVTVEFDIDRRRNVKMMIYDVSGRLVRVLAEGVMEPGRKSVTWDGCNDTGSAVASGVYFCRLIAGDFVQTRKMVLLR